MNNLFCFIWSLTFLNAGTFLHQLFCELSTRFVNIFKTFYSVTVSDIHSESDIHQKSYQYLHKYFIESLFQIRNNAGKDVAWSVNCHKYKNLTYFGLMKLTLQVFPSCIKSISRNQVQILRISKIVHRAPIRILPATIVLLSFQVKHVGQIRFCHNWSELGFVKWALLVIPTKHLKLYYTWCTKMVYFFITLYIFVSEYQNVQFTPFFFQANVLVTNASFCLCN